MPDASQAKQAARTLSDRAEKFVTYIFSKEGIPGLISVALLGVSIWGFVQFMPVIVNTWATAQNANVQAIAKMVDVLDKVSTTLDKIEANAAERDEFERGWQRNVEDSLRRIETNQDNAARQGAGSE